MDWDKKCSDRNTLSPLSSPVPLNSLLHLLCSYFFKFRLLMSFPFNVLTLWLGYRKGIWPVKKTGCWFVGGDDLTGAVHVL